jgi:hypothetical protein
MLFLPDTCCRDGVASIRLLILMQRFAVLLNGVASRRMQFVKTVLKKELLVRNVEFMHSYLITAAVALHPLISRNVGFNYVLTDKTCFWNVIPTLGCSGKLASSHHPSLFIYD